MLVLNVYSVRDLKAECYSQPYFASNDAVAVRMFSDVCKDVETPIGAHPSDYALFRVGVWNTESGSLAGTDVPIPVMTGVDAMSIKGGK